MHTFDAIVVGTGGMGSAAACHLARRGVRVLALDRFPPAHDRGSSHGQTRLIRLAYYEHPDYVPLLLRARDLWRELEADVGRPLLVETGLLAAGPPAGAVVAGTRASARAHSLPLESLSAREAVARWPAFRMPDDWQAVFESRAGHLAVEDCVRAHMDMATRAGATLRHGVTVHDWHIDGGRVTVRTDGGAVTADRLVLCPGPWAAGMLRLPRPPLVVLRKSLFWYAPPDGGVSPFAAGRFPCFAFDTPAGFFYGFPPVDARGLKVAEHTGGRVITGADDVDRGIDPRERQRIEGWLGDHLPGMGTRLLEHAACLYTMTPDHHFLLGLHPDHPQVSLAAGFSGHGFKFASVVGELLADLATTGRTVQPIGFLSPTRFT